MVVGDVVVTMPVERIAFTFAIVVLFAPNDARSERIDWTCELVRFEGVLVVGAVPPFRTMFTFVIAAVLAPNEERSELSELICVLVRPVGIDVVGVDPSHALPVVELKPEYEEQPDG